MGDVLATNPSSSNPNIVYRVLKGGDGVIYCDCPGWKMRKDCKHLKAYHTSKGTKGTAPALMGAPVQNAPKVKSQSTKGGVFVLPASGPMLGVDPIDPTTFNSDEFQAQPWYQGCGSEIESEKPED